MKFYGVKSVNLLPLLLVALWLVLLNLYVEHQLTPALFFVFIPIWILLIGLLCSFTRNIFMVNVKYFLLLLSTQWFPASFFDVASAWTTPYEPWLVQVHLCPCRDDFVNKNVESKSEQNLFGIFYLFVKPECNKSARLTWGVGGDYGWGVIVAHMKMGLGRKLPHPSLRRRGGGWACACTAGNIARPGKKLRSSKKT